MNSQLSSASPVIDVGGVTRQFGGKRAMDNVTLSVPAGVVFGLVGENGAGKTTLIKHVLGLLRPQTGTVRVFGLDPVADPPGVLARIGYLSENRDLPGWMRVDELIRYTQAFYKTWDAEYAEKLRVQFGLDNAARVKNLSRGETARAGLLLALAHKPPLLVLDEPSSGLDPVVRRDILEAIIRTVAEEGRTILFSSHLLEEVERVSDHLAMMHNGRLVLCGPLEEIKHSHRRLVIRFDSPLSRAPTLDGAIAVTGAGQEWTVICNGIGNVATAANRLGGKIVSEHAPSLDEIFVAHASAH
ncbi:MAG TPA: ABC transporter ATP-binding protein [Candidatus Binatia bacterium]|nr:ABC transporter ATP-binding protein [Candidatus Binatia bacterium]